jgi:hypothetical protein
MSTGIETINWLYNDQLKVDGKWAVKTDTSFSWWADKNKQTIEIIAEEELDGMRGYLISVNTDVLISTQINEGELDILNNLIMKNASMSGVVYDENLQTLKLHSLLRVHEAIADWMNPLISVASTLQIAEANRYGQELINYFPGELAVSGHPENGIRNKPDEMAGVVQSLFAPIGKEPCHWQEQEFESAVQDYMQRPPSICASNGGLGLSVEFPFDNQSSLCEFKGTETHPVYGNGLFIKHSFPPLDLSNKEGVNLALSLNKSSLTELPHGYGIGSYCYNNDMLQHVTFLPNALYRPGLIPSLYSSCATRAEEVTFYITGKEWTSESFDLKYSSFGRVMENYKGN